MNDNTKYGSFRTYKERVSIQQVASSLGYRVDPKAGRGKYIEMVLPGASGKQDTIIISNPVLPDRENTWGNVGRQMYFRRGESRGGDVIKFVRENIDALLPGPADKEWKRVGKYLADMANMPFEMNEVDRVSLSGSHGGEFDPDRYPTRVMTADSMSRLMATRGLTQETVGVFAKHLVQIRDSRIDSFKGYNLGFPYTNPATGEIAGYEIRGFNGFKSKAAGTDSSSSCWIADFTGGTRPRDIYFFESGFDAMAFYQANRLKINLNRSVFISTGGQLGARQTDAVVKHYGRDSNYFDCFDNDEAGRKYGVHLAMAVAGVEKATVDNKDGVAIINAPGLKPSIVALPTEDCTADKISKAFDLGDRIKAWTAPRGFKDWNDFVLGKSSLKEEVKTGYQREENLARQRGANVKF